MKRFKPMLAIDATDHINNIKYPKLASYKLDGIRCIFHPVLGMVSRSLKFIQNKQLKEKFERIVNLSKSTETIYDGELYSHELTFQEITRAVMTQDFWDSKTKKKLMNELGFDDEDNDINSAKYIKYVNRLIDNIKFHMFEYLDLFYKNDPTFSDRYDTMNDENNYLGDYVVIVKQVEVNSSYEIEELFIKVLKEGYEGLILRSPESYYKHGRSTLKEEGMLKIKPFNSFDTKIIGIEQSTKVDPNAEKSVNELGHSVTSRKKDDRILIPKASAFFVKYKKNTLKVSIAMTDEEKMEVWENQSKYIGRMIEYKGMLIGAKDVPRHPVFIRFREDRD